MTEEREITFAPPSADMVERALRDLDYNDRFVGYAMTASAGNAAKDIYSLRDAVLFLVGTPWNAPMLHPGFKGALNWVDVARFAAWLRDVVGDDELAQAVEDVAVGLESYRAQAEAVAALLNERMVQYREAYDVAHASDAAADDADTPAAG